MTWADYMETATKGQRVIDFDPPAYVNRDDAPRAHGDHATAADLRAHRGADQDPRTDAYAERRAERDQRADRGTDGGADGTARPKTTKPTTPRSTPTTSQRGRPGRGKTPGASG